MTQEIPPPISIRKVRKGFLVFVIVLLILGFMFFYLASYMNWNHETYYTYVKIPSTSYYPHSFPFGSSPFVIAMSLDVQNLDHIKVYCQPTNVTDHANDTFYIALYSNFGFMGQRFLVYSNSLSIDYVFHLSPTFQDEVDIIIASPNIQNETVYVTATVQHFTYETLIWVFFIIGVILSSLAVILIFKSKKT